jgi:hypothetical protein
VRRDELLELHFITPIANMTSVSRLGILSHKRMEKIPHASVAMGEIQDLRAKKTVPNGRPLHEYANLYFHARNPMMYKRRGQHEALCVVRVSTNVLDLAGVVITDSNAAAKDQYVRFAPAPSGLKIVDRAETFARWWTSDNHFEECRLRSRKSAEVLVPDGVTPNFLTGVYVSGDVGQKAYAALGLAIPATTNADMFFR